MSAEMLIAELPFSNSSHPPESHIDTNTQLPGVPVHAQHIDIARVEASFATLQASKAFLEHFLTFELPDFMGFSFPVLLNFFRAAQILYRLRVMDDPGWDRSAVANSVDILAAMDLVSNRFNQLPNVYGFLTETDAEGNEVTNFYVKCAKTFSCTSPMWRAHFTQADAPKASTDTIVSAAETISQVTAPVMGACFSATLGSRANYPGMRNFMMPEVFPMDFSMDDVWCNEIMVSHPESLFPCHFESTWAPFLVKTTTETPSKITIAQA